MKANKFEELFLNRTCDIRSQLQQQWKGSDWQSLTEAAAITGLSLIIIVTSATFLGVLGSRRVSGLLRGQPKVLLSSLAFADLLRGITVIPSSVYPTLYGCWSLGTAWCAIEAVASGALFQISLTAHILIAIERYLRSQDPQRHYTVISRGLCGIAVIFQWILSFLVFSILSLPESDFYLDLRGLRSCRVYLQSHPWMTLEVVLFYFTPTLGLMYCYGTIFHKVRIQVRKVTCSTITRPEDFGGESSEMKRLQEETLNIKNCNTLAAAALACVVSITPWAMTQIVVACTGAEVPAWLELTATWIAMSNSCWTLPLLCISSPDYRRATFEFVDALCCRKTESVDSCIVHHQVNGRGPCNSREPLQISTVEQNCISIPLGPQV